MLLSELLARKQVSLISVTDSEPLLDAIRTMYDNKVGSLLIRSTSDTLLGIVTERDILRFCSERGGDLKGTRIDEVMTRDLVVATPETTTEEAMSIMTERRFRHLPVIEGGKPIGIISIGDLVKAELKNVSVEVKYLRDFISA